MRTSAWAQAASMKFRSLPVEGEIPPLTGATAWINTAPLTPADLRGKVVLVVFWTYTCINWRRSHAFVRAWAQRYSPHGLVVLGVHTPEFPFEHNVGNVQRAVQDIEITYPVAVDSDYAIWNAFNNNYWPAFYFVDAQGRIRYHQFGEGSYEQSEMIIQRLLTEAGSTGFGHGLTPVNGHGFEAAADWADLQSPENYLGYERTENFASRGGAVHDEKSHLYRSNAVGSQSMGVVRRLDDGKRPLCAECSRGADREPISCARPAPCHGRVQPIQANSLSRHDRRHRPRN